MRHQLLLLTSLSGLCLFAACQGNQTPTPTPPGIAPVSTAAPAQPTATASTTTGAATTAASTPAIAATLPAVATSGASTTHAQTFYVATTGNDDSGDGSAAAPWATITKALDSVPDDSLILVQPGLYEGRVRIRGTFASGVTVRSAQPYLAQLRAQDETVLTIYEAIGISIEGFDIAHSGVGAAPVLVHIQDQMNEIAGAGVQYTSRIVLRDNILHDSYNNDIIKLNNGARDVQIIGNMFYNQGDSDEHIDINSVENIVVAENIFFNDFGGSGRALGDPSSYIVIKDSNDTDDSVLGAQNITVRQNVMLNWEGSGGYYFILTGEDGVNYYEANNVLIENNLLLGNSTQQMRAPYGAKGVQNVVFRHNTVWGDLPSSGFAMRLNVEGDNLPNQNIQFYNNIWADPTGSLNNFAVAPAGETASFVLQHNLYWNGGAALPSNPDELVNLNDDSSASTRDPLLPSLSDLVVPRWQGTQFADGSSSIRQAFERLVLLYGTPGDGSFAIDQADPAQAPAVDILGNPRPLGSSPDLGAVESAATAGDPNAPTPVPPTPLPAQGSVVFTLDGAVYRVAAQQNGALQNISADLNAAGSTGADSWGNLSANGQWLLLATERFHPDCAGWACLAVLGRDLQNPQAVVADGAVIHPDDFGAVSNNGNLVIYTAGGGSHERDLWAVKRNGDVWSAPLELTGASSFAYNRQPALNTEGTEVVFDCGDDPYGQAGTALCAVNSDGSGWRVLLRPEQGAAGGANNALHHPAFAPDGSVVFEADWNGEQIWRLPSGSSEPVLVQADSGNDNSPCVLPDGSVASLWLQRPGNNNSFHELKIVSADGSGTQMVYTGADIADLGIGCGAP